jgi:hypothetical protein
MINRGKPKNSEKKVLQSHFVHHESHSSSPRTEPSVQSPDLWHGLCVTKQSPFLMTVKSGLAVRDQYKLQVSEGKYSDEGTDDISHR